jgi:NAD(P)-dependent dehydrogenase (short-subunit alcohol dehydrogenase family)
VLARDPGRAESTQRALRAKGVPALGLAVDVADADAVEAAADRVEAELGPIDVWVNNAMATLVQRASALTPEELRRVTDVTYHGTVFGTQAALRRMAHRGPHGRGGVIQVASLLAFRPMPLQAAYCAAKNAVVAYTASLRTELAHDGTGVTLSVLYLPGVNTPQPDWARNRMGKAQEIPAPVYDPRAVAREVVRLADHPRREVWFGRTAVMSALGQWVSPTLMDAFMARTAWSGQLSDGPPPNPEGNLFEPVPGEVGIDGPKTDEAIDHSHELVTSRGRDAAVLGTSALALTGLTALVRRITR